MSYYPPYPAMQLMCSSVPRTKKYNYSYRQTDSTNKTKIGNTRAMHLRLIPVVLHCKRHTQAMSISCIFVTRVWSRETVEGEERERVLFVNKCL